MKGAGPVMAVMGIFLSVQVAKAQWTPAKRLTWNSSYSVEPNIAIRSFGDPYVVWSDYSPGYWEIFYKKSADGGATWSTSQRLTWTTSGSADQVIAVDSSGNLHVVYYDGLPGKWQIYYTKSADGGANWTTSRRLTWTSGWAYSPAIAVTYPGNLHVVWQDDTPGNSEIYYRRSTDRGATWSTSQRLTWSSGKSECPAIAVDTSGNLHVVWQDDAPGNSEVYYRRSTDGGTTWTPSKRLSWTLLGSWNPAIAGDSAGHLHVVWEAGNGEIYYKKSTDGGATWSISQRLTWTSENSYYPAIAVDPSGNLHVVWDDNTPGNPEVYYKKSTDGGATWTTSQRLTWNSGDSWHPTIAADSSGNLHVVWDDDTPGNFEIYYKKFIK